MSIRPGQILLNYRVVEKIGEGGMGEVWKATDTSLDREVAIKILPDTVARDRERMLRFEREAKLLASLNHPNVAGIHGFHPPGSTEHGIGFFVMELVGGEDLSHRILRGPLPLEEVLALARQIAEALESAHRRGVIHRDLKPANIKLTPDGTIKVLDFGLAKPMDSEPAPGGEDPTRSPTITSAGTMAGVILGTAAYMSPEQARGKTVDSRSDVFSFGCVLFEMLAGAPAFRGEDVSEILASVIKGDVQWDRLPADLPGPVRELVERCLRVRRDERYQAIGDARIDLAAMLEHPERLQAGEPDAVARGRRLSRRAALLGAVLGLAIGLGAGWAFLGRPSPPPGQELVKFRIPSDAAPRWFNRPDVSPDGRSVAFNEPDGLWVRRLDRLEPAKIDLPWPAWRLAWSPDSRTLVLARADARELWRVPPDGGEPLLITTLPDEGFLWGVAALDEDTLVFGMADAGLFRVPLRGGTPEQILAAEENELLTGPWPLPGGRGILLAEAGRGRIEVWDGSERRIVLEIEGQRIFDPLYSPSGHLLFNSQYGKTGNWAVPFSIDRLEVSGTPFRILPAGNVSISNDDTLVYFSTTPVNDRPARLVWVDRQGTVGEAIGEPLRGLIDPALSPDDRRIAVGGWPDPSKASTGDVLVLDVGTGARYELDDALGDDHYPFWWADGSQIGYVTFAAGVRSLRLRAADGSGEPVELDRAQRARGTRDGRYLVYSWPDDGIQYLESGSSEAKLLTPEYSSGFDLSPDHRLLAFVEPNQAGIFLRNFPDGTGLTAAVAGEALEPAWSRDGTELFFWRGDTLMAVEIDTRGATPRVGQPRPLFSAEERRLISGTRFDIGPDGRFLMVQELEREAADSGEPAGGILVIRNWYLEWGAPR